MKHKCYNSVEHFKEMIQSSLSGIRKEEVRVLKEMDSKELVYRVASVMQTCASTTKKQRIVMQVPVASIASGIGKMVLVGKEEPGMTKKQRNKARFKVGWHFLEVLADNKIIDIEKGPRKRDQYMVKVRKQKWFNELITSVNLEPDADIAIYTKPMLREPLPWIGFHNKEGGVLVRNADPSVEEHFTPEKCPKVFDVINKHQENEYIIDTDLLSIYKQGRNDLKVFTLTDKNLSKVQREGMEREFDRVLEIAEGLGERKFYEYMFYDNRGRIYSSTVYLSHAGSKLSKSLIQLKEKKPLGQDGWFWLLVHAANCFGYDKETIENRFEFAEKQLPTWMEMANNPLVNTTWQKADSPFEFISAILEISKAMKHKNKFEYPSGLMVAWDATCSGLQVLSALSRDQKSGELCNLTETEVRGDYYQTIGDAVWNSESMQYTEEEEKMFDEIQPKIVELQEARRAYEHRPNSEEYRNAKKEEREYFEAHKETIYSLSKVYWSRLADKRRKICKRPCMTYFYSCGVRTMANAMMTDHGSDKDYVGLTPSYCFWLCYEVFQACKKEMPGPTALMELFIKMGVEDYKKGEKFTLEAPTTNFKMIQTYQSDGTEQIAVNYRGERIRILVALVPNDRLDYQKIKNASSPNVVHMLDSQIVAGIVLKEKDYIVSCIHDSFSTTAADAGKLYEDIREVFVDLFSDDVLKRLLEQKGLEELHELIEYGDLNIYDVFDNEYVFS